MKLRRFTPLLLAAFLIGSLIVAGVAAAADYYVPADYPTIQDAIKAAADFDTIHVAPGTYAESITLRDNVYLQGDETARTILAPGGSGPIMTATGAISTYITGFTFLNAGVGIQISGDASEIDITNNVFQLGNGGVGISIQSSPSVSILNNTFYDNGTAISRDSDNTIKYNIFANNTTAISQTSGLSANVTYNAFFNNITTGPTGTNVVTGDPLFVDPSVHDFHLKANSPCIDAGGFDLTYYDSIDNSDTDIGAYGGPYMDLIPFPVSGLTVAAKTATSIDLTWQPNNCYMVTSGTDTSLAPGGYRLHYGYVPGTFNGNSYDPTSYQGTDEESGTQPSPKDVGPYTEYTMLDLNPLARVPSTPDVASLTHGDSQLTISWTAVSNAEGYIVHYGSLSPGENAVDVGSVTSYTITGLTNGQQYQVAVSAYATAKYYMAVDAYDSTFDNIYSDLTSETSTQLGSTLESGLSAIQADSPDIVVGYPGLPNTGGKCFIATSAYGSYDAPEVIALRSFRDKYLLTSKPGRWFVAWYYRNGPVAAALLDAHPAFKPLVRAALLPFVGVALFFSLDLYLRICILLCAASGIFTLALRMRSRKRGRS